MYSWFGDSSGSRTRCQFIYRGQANGKGSALTRSIVGTNNFATVFFHDSVTDAEAEAGSFADLLGGEERIKDAVGMGDAVAVVAECHLDVIIFAVRGNIDTWAGYGFTDSIVGIIQDVEKYLLQLL